MSTENYRRRLPHLHPPGGTLFITCRLAGSLPQHIVDQFLQPPTGSGSDADTAQQLETQRHFFRTFEDQLERGGYGPTWLAVPEVRALCLGSLQHQHHQGCYQLIAACVMPNHLHAVLVLPQTAANPFQVVWGRFKTYTALHANRLLGRTGRFWQEETYDHIVRGGAAAVARVVQYVVQNPVKAGLCATPADWPGTVIM